MVRSTMIWLMSFLEDHLSHAYEVVSQSLGHYHSQCDYGFENDGRDDHVMMLTF